MAREVAREQPGEPVEKLTAAAPPPEPAVVELQHAGRSLRELTVYLPVELAQALSLHCLERGYDVSSVVAEAVRQHVKPGETVAEAAVSLQAVLSNWLRDSSALLSALWQRRPRRA